MNSEEFRNMLVEMVKASGQEVIDRAEELVGSGDRAEELVGSGDLLTDFYIWLRFPLDNGRVSGVPTIELTKSYLSKGGMNTIMKYYTNDSKGE